MNSNAFQGLNLIIPGVWASHQIMIQRRLPHESADGQRCAVLFLGVPSGRGDRPNDVFAELLRVGAGLARFVLTLRCHSPKTNQRCMEPSCARASGSLATPGLRALAPGVRLGRLVADG